MLPAQAVEPELTIVMCDVDHTGIHSLRANICTRPFRVSCFLLGVNLELQARTVFVSYRSLDDEPPPESSKDYGFVRYLSKQVRWELRQLGVPSALLWRDRGEIEPGDNWSEAIRLALSSADLFLAVLSRNYIQSTWCINELSTMASRIDALDAQTRQRRIFRVDKHSVPDNQIPEPLRAIQSVRFYAEDDETHRDDEYFWRGKVRREKEYMDAVHELAQAICERLRQLGISLQPQPVPLADAIGPSNGRTVFVAKPAGDVVEQYRTLVHELRRTGYRVTPDPDKDLPKDGDAVRGAIAAALAEAEASIHLLGERTGGRSDGLDVDLVPLQLASAAQESQRKSGFQRLIWAPATLPQRASDDAELPRRDPMGVLERFDRRLAIDEIVGDTASRFNEFVLQRLGDKLQTPASQTGPVYIRCSSGERNYGLSMARALKRVGFAPVLNLASTEGTAQDLARAEEAMLRQAQRVVVCWGLQNRLQILAEVTTPTLQAWRAARPKDRKLILILNAPVSEPKTEVAELGFGPDVDCVVDATKGEKFDELVSALEQSS
jgi:TIR domain